MQPHAPHVNLDDGAPAEAAKVLSASLALRRPLYCRRRAAPGVDVLYGHTPCFVIWGSDYDWPTVGTTRNRCGCPRMTSTCREPSSASIRVLEWAPPITKLSLSTSPLPLTPSLPSPLFPSFCALLAAFRIEWISSEDDSVPLRKLYSARSPRFCLSRPPATAPAIIPL